MAKPARGGGERNTSPDKKTPPPRSPSQSSRTDPPHKGEGQPGVQRRPAHDGREASGQGVRVSVLPPAERISLRAPAGSVAALSKALGAKLPTKPKTSATSGGRTMLWLGPDEWLVIDEDGKDPLADCAKVKELHSAVGISHRNVAMAVTGPNCEATISSGCPQDLSLVAFPVGACSRTILGKSEIVLLRTAARRIPRRMLAVVLRLRLCFPGRRGKRCGGLSCGTFQPTDPG